MTLPPTWEDIKATILLGHIDWKRFLDERQLKEVEFSRIYATQFSHGTDGHNAKLIIARMAQLLDLIEQHIEFLPEDK